MRLAGCVASTCITALALLGCGIIAPERPRNLILVSIDTLRLDMLGAYGYDRPSSPTFDALAARGALFEAAVSPAPWTMPAHASLLTGLYPKRHGMKSHEFELSSETPTLAEMLAVEGFLTAAIVNSHILSDRFGMQRGFEQHTYVREAEARRKPTQVEQLALEWLSVERTRPFFLFLHFYDLHSDYRSLAPYESEFLRPYKGRINGRTWELRRFRNGELDLDAGDAKHLEDLYVAGIRQLDDGLARLLAALRRHGTLEDTLLVVTTDHGEEFLDHGGVLHGRTQYDEVLRVPLLMLGPGIPHGLRIREPVSLIDLVPTLLSLLGLPAPADTDGVDVSRLLRGEALPELSERPLFGEADWLNAAPDMTRSIRLGGFKGILDRVAGSLEVYDLSNDPGEERPVTEAKPELAERMREALEGFMLDEVQPDPTRAVEPLDDQEIERLEALGYL